MNQICFELEAAGTKLGEFYSLVGLKKRPKLCSIELGLSLLGGWFRRRWRDSEVVATTVSGGVVTKEEITAITITLKQVTTTSGVS